MKPDMTLLTPEDISKLTGAGRSAQQIEVLAKNGIFYIVDKQGKPKLTWYHVNHPSLLEVKNQYEQPDFSMFDQVG